MILVTGVTGAVGRELLALLTADGKRLRILAREPRRAPVTSPQVQVVQGSYADRCSLDRALRGVRAAFLVTNSPDEPDDARFTAAAQAAGVRHLVKLSMMSVTDADARDLITRRQRENELLIRQSGLDWTFLRARTFMSNTLMWAPGIRAEGVVRALYGTSPISCVDPRDIAAVAARVLTEPGHAGTAYALSGPEPITARQQTDRLSRLIGRRLRFEELDREQARLRLLQRYPRAVVEAFLQSAERQRAEAKAGVVSTVSDLVGRPARTYAAWAADHRAAFV
ncbi:NAD(P)H-binding protein [Streptomyces sp. NPDC057638]|uniref:NAD(P)H-binding protein n=1 Tax=Streptomyces sp. NPDC057638 TaxID=3346190 RepID=UPI0036B9E43C